MDCLKIEHEVTKNFVSGLISKVITEKIGSNVNIGIDYLKVYRDERDKFHIELDANADINLITLLKHLM